MKKRTLILVVIGTAVLTALVMALLMNIFERRQEARLTYFRISPIPEGDPDPAVWGKNFPLQYDALMKTLRTSELAPYSPYGRYGGSEAFSKLDREPDLKRIFAGYSFAVEYRDDRGHEKALDDMLATKRLGDKKPGTCMTCKSSQVPGLMKSLGPEKFYTTPVKEMVETYHVKFSIACADCHDSRTMALTISRPAFREAMARRGVDFSKASPEEMRTYVCAQCHVEYYFQGPGKYLVFPWTKGLSVDSIEAYYDAIQFSDWEHAETKASLVKMQHPDYEFWSTGIHARSGVTCPDCHMPYTRVGSVKISDHWVRSPLVNVTNACATCHRLSDEELRGRVLEIQDRSYSLMMRGDTALIAAQDAIQEAMKQGVPDEALKEARAWHRRAFLRWDYMSAENSMGFHSPQEGARILGDAIDDARRAELAAYKAMMKVPKK
jgi:nitrite reductase (cytochrome c-552)